MNSQQRILLVDDEPAMRLLVKSILGELGCAFEEAGDGRQALDMIAARPPDLVISDVTMPGVDGYGLCKRLKGDPRTRLIPIVMISALSELPDRVKALELDADDYLSKPFNSIQLQARVRSLLRGKRYTDELENAAAVLQGIAAVVEKRDAYVGNHCLNVELWANRVGLKMGLQGEALAHLRLGAALHDLGKIGVDDAVLRKAGKLDEDEWAIMRRHPLIGADLLAPMRTLAGVLPLVRHHHERLDGSGYPDGLKSGAIPLEVRILSVVDIFEALISRRPYKEPMPTDKALRILGEEAAKGWWDPQVVGCLAEILGAAEGAPA
jgi:putative two-component system response regulator